MSPKWRTEDRSEGSVTEKRIFIMGGILAVCFGILICRAVYFQLASNEQLENVALRQYRTAVSESTKRGRIYDSNGRELAIDVTVGSMFANPREIEEPVKTAGELAAALKVDRQKLLDKLSSKRKFVWVERKVSEEETKKVEALGIKGIYMMRENKRFYPSGSVAAHVLGAVGFDAEPLGGIELYYNSQLSSETRPGNFKRDARGHLYLSPMDVKAVTFENAWLTLDRTIQFIAERELGKGVAQSKAKGGVAVVVDVNTGDVLAMANFPSFDPNEYSSYPVSQWRNLVVSDPFEPGSTFKTVVIASALDAKLATSEDIFDCENGRIVIGNHVIGDSHPRGKLSVADIIKVSSNIGAYKVEKLMGWDELYGHLKSFGFGVKSGVDLPGESQGIMAKPSSWSPLQHATIAFGQGIAATPLQMTMAFAAIANGGKLLKPHMVKKLTDEKGVPVFEAGAEVRGYPISPDTASLMRRLLGRVVEKGGTGTLAASLEYDVAGKTGTAQKADPRTGGYAKGRYFSSFIGFAPRDNPRIAVFIGMDEPKGLYYGGQVAAPVFRNVVDATLHYLKVPGKVVTASNDVVNQLPPVANLQEDFVYVDLAQKANEGNASLEVEKQVRDDGEESWKIPDFGGLTMREVLKVSRGADIDIRFEGSGIAVSQSPPPGSVVPSGALCKVEFRPMM